MADVDLTINGTDWENGSSGYPYFPSYYLHNFASNSDYLVGSYDSKLEITTAFTFSAWTKPAASTAADTYLWSRLADGNSDNQISVHTYQDTNTLSLYAAGGLASISNLGKVSTGTTAFDGTDDYCAFTPTSVNQATNISIGTWTGRVNGQWTVISDVRASNQDYLRVTLLIDNNNDLYAAIGDDSSTLTYGTAASMPQGRYFYCMVFDGSGGSDADRLKVYRVNQKNEITQITLSFTGSIPAALPSITATTWSIGKAEVWSGSDRYANSEIWEYQLWNGSLSSSDIQSAAKNPGSVTTNLGVHFRMDQDAAPSSETDQAGTTENGTWYGSPSAGFEWRHYAWVFESSGGAWTLKTYRDGILRLSESGSGSLTATASTGDLYIGAYRYNGSTEYPYDGYIGPIRLYKNDRSHTDIMDLATNTTPTDATNFIWGVDCNENAGTVTYDISEYGAGGGGSSISPILLFSD